ncbi:MAG: hypothetical protein J4G18_12370 [Anaerolineae bacterium]|nr:hypothetical protein [Anaerolineae bacterium]
MSRKRVVTWLVIGFVLLACASLVSAHQPVCEFADLTADAPWQVPDPTISYAYFGNVYPPQDIDYFTFDALRGQSILLSMSIPADDEDEQDFYLPKLAVLGPGLPRELPAELPRALLLPEGHGALMVPLGDTPAWFFEPFGRVHFWNWDDYYFQVPQDASYTVALWHPEAEIGRYTFVIGEKEVFGGDMECFIAFATYWTPILEGSNPYRDTPMDMLLHDPSQVINIEPEGAPTVELNVFPLPDGSFNLQLRTSNFTFTPQNIDKAPVLGEGHAHLYVDGVKIARLYGEWHHVPTLPPDSKLLTVSLYANNHQSFAVDGEIISSFVLLEGLSAEESE